jgi:hypothetical protein
MSDSKPYIDITISPTGDVKVEAQRYKGVGCKDATRPYVTALGVPDETTAKPEMYQAPTTTTQRDVKS